MSAPDADRIRALLGGPPYEKLFAAARRRIEEAGEGARSVTVAGLETSERIALADLLGLDSLPDGPVRLEIERLDVALRESAAGTPLRGVLEALGGPLRDRRAERVGERAERERMWADARARLEAAGRGELAEWLAALRTSGTLARAARYAARPERAVLSDALEVALRLPAGGKLLAVFAGEVLGDPHALDAGAALAPLALRAAAAIAGWPEVPSGAAGRRRLWADVGVDCDPLSASVLVHGLRPGGTGLLARHLRESADEGEPRRVTLRELERSELSFAPGAVLYVCENPAVVTAAADALGSRSAALVCTEGVPSTAVVHLLRRCVAAGTRLRVRADFDWPGLRIAAQLMALGSAQPWRFSASDYETAIVEGRTGPPLDGARASAPWDATLPARMAIAGKSVPEERLLDTLLADLAPQGG